MSAQAPYADAGLILGIPGREHYNAVQSEATARPGLNRKSTIESPSIPMSESDGLTQELFDRLLVWLGPDRETAAQKYEAIRNRLIRVFICRGSNLSEELADRTINRVARKLPEIEANYSGDPAPYFLSAARFIFLESQRKERVPAVGMPVGPPPDPDDNRNYDYLQRCLAELPPEDRNLIESYYQFEKHEKIEHRKKLADRSGMGLNALRIRACRIRSALLSRVEELRVQEDMKQNRAKGHSI